MMLGERGSLRWEGRREYLAAMFAFVLGQVEVVKCYDVC